MVYDALRLRGNSNPLAGLVAFAWNPLVLLECLANGHNDLAMMFFVALALWCWQKHRHTEFLLALVCGGLIKYVPFLLLPFALLALYRRLGWRRWLQTSVVAGMLGVALMAVTLAPLWPGWRLWSLGGQMQQGHNSVFAWLVLTLARLLDYEVAYSIANVSLKIALAGGYGLLLIEAWRGRLTLANAWYRVLLLYLVVGSSSFGYWYITWLVLLAPFVSDYQQRLWTLALSWCGLMSVPLYTYLGTWIEPSWPDLNIHLVAVPFMFLVPFVISPWVGGLLPPALGPWVKRGQENGLPTTERVL